MKIAPAVYAKAPMMPMTTAAQGSTTEHDAAQFHGADQQVKNAPGFPPGEEPTLSRYYTSHWNDGWFGGKFVWSHRFQNMIILVGFILFFRFATFYALERINYSTR